MTPANLGFAVACVHVCVVCRVTPTKTTEEGHRLQPMTFDPTSEKADTDTCIIRIPSTEDIFILALPMVLLGRHTADKVRRRDASHSQVR